MKSGYVTTDRIRDLYKNPPGPFGIKEVVKSPPLKVTKQQLIQGLQEVTKDPAPRADPEVSLEVLMDTGEDAYPGLGKPAHPTGPLTTGGAPGGRRKGHRERKNDEEEKVDRTVSPIPPKKTRWEEYDSVVVQGIEAQNRFREKLNELDLQTKNLGSPGDLVQKRYEAELEK
jgi:hypothetical protein